MRLKVDFSENNSCLKINFIETNCTFNTNFGEVLIVHKADPYKGEYTVTPRVYQQILPTTGLMMTEDLEITGIPKQTVLNPKNGYTVTIG